MELIIVEQNRREKTFPIQKGVIRVGSAAVCDVKLPSSAVHPLHLQIFYSVQQPDYCRVQNIGPEIYVNIQGKRQKLPSSSTIEMTGGDEIFIDRYKLAFKLPISNGVIRTSPSIEASLDFPTPVLYRDIPTLGTLTVCNTGKSPSCQFQIRVSGLPGDCFRIDPPPMVYPDVPEQFLVYIIHQKRYPQAGFHEIKLTVSETNAYPGEEVIIRQYIYVMPVFETTIELQDDIPARDSAEWKQASAVVSVSSPNPVEPLQPPLVAESTPSAIEAQRSTSAQSVRKVQQNIPEEYWTDTSVNVTAEKNPTN